MNYAIPTTSLPPGQATVEQQNRLTALLRSSAITPHSDREAATA